MRNNKNLISRLLWSLGILLIGGLSLICYWSASALFFIADDFVWLERAKFLIPKEPFSIFKSEGLYFDPLVHLLFWVNHIFAGLNPAGYHYIDIFIHAINALLTAYLTFLLAENKTAAFFSGLIFAVSPTNADAVFWPSSRVDTIAATFYLGSLISYVLYQRDRKRFYPISLIFFIMSLSAKSTAIMLPLVILTLDMTRIDKMHRKDILVRLPPFFLIFAGYLFLLFYESPKILTSQVAGSLNIKEFLRSITVLFFPESLIAANEKLYTYLSVLFFISTAGLGLLYTTYRAFSTAIIMIAAITVPLLFIPMSFRYATEFNFSYFLLSSICHRLYLAVIPFSILMGLLITSFLGKIREQRALLSFSILVLFSIGIFAYGYTFIKKREQLWQVYANQFRVFARFVEIAKKQDITRYPKIYLMSMPFSFKESMFRVYSNNSGLVVKQVSAYFDVPDTVLKEKAAVLLLGDDRKIYDITQEINKYQYMIYTCGNYGKEEKENCSKELSLLTQKLNSLKVMTVPTFLRLTGLDI